MAERITASLATIPSRRHAVVHAIDSLFPQVDEVVVYVNGEMEPLPERPGLRVIMGGPDLGDAGKFAPVPTEGYHLACDDDLYYPPDYAEATIRGIERYGRKAVVSWHGGVILGPVESYYRGGRSPYFACLRDVAGDNPVNVPGTGVLGYHVSTVPSPGTEPFRNGYMADIWMALYLQARAVPVVVLAHRAGWIRHLLIDLDDTIYARYAQRDEEQTRVVNAHAWNLY
jgi:hypothetical protein